MKPITCPECGGTLTIKRDGNRAILAGDFEVGCFGCKKWGIGGTYVEALNAFRAVFCNPAANMPERMSPDEIPNMGLPDA